MSRARSRQAIGPFEKLNEAERLEGPLGWKQGHPATCEVRQSELGAP